MDAASVLDAASASGILTVMISEGVVSVGAGSVGVVSVDVVSRVADLIAAASVVEPLAGSTARDTPVVVSTAVAWPTAVAVGSTAAGAAGSTAVAAVDTVAADTAKPELF